MSNSDSTSSPASLSSHIVFRMVRLGHRAMHDANARLEAAGHLSASFQRILFHTRRHAEISQTELAHLLGYTGAAVSRQVGILEDRGYLERVVGQDKRRVVISITGKGQTELDASLAICLPVLDERLTLLTASEQATLDHLLTKMSAGQDHHPIS